MATDIFKLLHGKNIVTYFFFFYDLFLFAYIVSRKN